MEHFVVSAIKYRPKTFRDVVGQQAITNTLLNAIENNHLAQALLFCGPRGVGKTTCARILAKKINQQAQAEPAPDEDYAFNIFELDAASNNSVDDIRSLIDQVRIPPQVGKYKVYIIDEVHMLSQSAFNAFLKTLEEPPKHAIFILATTEKHKIIPTILSRCQIFDFKRITVKDAREYLAYIAEQQGITAEEEALHIIAQKADGAMRDALSIFDRVVSFSGKQLTLQAVTENLNVLDYQTYFRMTDLILDQDIPGLMLAFDEILSKGFDAHHFIAGLASHFRDLMVCKNPATIALLEVGEDTRQRYTEQSAKTSLPFLLKALDLANECDFNFKQSNNQRLHVELCLMQLASILYDGEKKNDGPFIIPAEALKPDGGIQRNPEIRSAPKPVEKAASKPSAQVAETSNEVIPKSSPAALATAESKESTPSTLHTPNAEAPKNNPAAIAAPAGNRPVSGLTLASLRAIKAHELNKKDQRPQEENLPTDPFTEEALNKAWEEYVRLIDTKGRKILASALGSDQPKLKSPQVFFIILPNDTMKKEVESEMYPLMEFLKQKLNNYRIELEIEVNEEAAKQYAFTPIEKYEKLRELNPHLDLLRATFDLDV